MDAASKTNNVEGSMDMKLKLQAHYGWICLAFAAAVVSTSGCKSSGFSLPGKSMFGWNRQPDAATLAGNTKVPNLPESPAAKYDPTAIASKSGSPGKPAGSAYGYGGAGTGTASSGTAQPGGAAIANGYQSGPYPMASTATAPPTTTASTATAGALPSPYGGTYNGSMASLNTPSTAAGSGDVPLPSSVTNALGRGVGATAGYSAPAMPGGGLPPLPNATVAGYTNNAPTNAATTAYQLPEGPTAGQTSAFTAGNNYTSSTPGSTVGGSAAAGSGMGLPSLPGSNSVNASTAGQAGSTATPNTSITTPNAYPSTAPANSYSPGSTGRSTGYDFGSKNAAGAAPANSAPGSTLPLLR